jgi:hypothetical protein
MPDMTCHEVRSHLQERGWPNAAASGPQEIMEHLANCAECGQFATSQRHLWTGLEMLRQSAPPLPASLDSAVLAGYRKAIAERGSQNTFATLAPRLRLRWLRFGAAFAALLLVATLSLVFRWRPTRAVVDPPMKPASQVAQAPKAADSESVRVQITAATKAKKRTSRSKPRSASVVSPVIAASEVSVPEGFRSLIYCDELICDGGMELVRVQLSPPFSASPAGWTSDSSPNRRVVSADVLVGTDGFARGIRITQ